MTLTRLDDHINSTTPSLVAAANPWIELMAPAAQLANDIAQTGFVPAEFRNKPAEIAACILYGAELGIPPMQSLAKIDIVKGRPAPRAELGRALANAAGHEIWVDESTNTRVTVSGRRRGSQRSQTVTWTMDDAKRAGIAGNPSYAKYPRQMLLARASAELVRAMCPEVLGGIVVFAEEAVDIDDDQPVPAIASTPTGPTGTKRQRKPPRTRRQSEKAPEPESTSDIDDDDAEPVDDDRPTRAQTNLALAMFKDQGMSDRSDRLNATSALLRRNVDTWSSLSRSDVSTLIDALERLKAGEIGFEIDNDGWHAIAIGDDLLDNPDDDQLTLDEDDTP